MSAVATVLEELLLSALLTDKTPSAGGNGTGRALAALSVLLAGAGVVLSVIGLERFLEGRYPPDLAALGAAAVVFAAALIAASAASCRRKSLRTGTVRDDLAKNIRVLLDAVSEELETPIRENPKTAVALAALAGFCALRPNDSL